MKSFPKQGQVPISPNWGNDPQRPFVTARAQGRYAANFGLQCTPHMSIKEAIGKAGSSVKNLTGFAQYTENDGGLIVLSEGIWDFYETLTLPASQRGISLVASAPSRTVFRRTQANGFSGPMLNILSDRVRLIGITFDDQYADADSTIDWTGGEGVLQSCVMYGRIPLQVYGARCQFLHNVIQWTDTADPVYEDGQQNLYLGNMLYRAPGGGLGVNAIYATDTSQSCSFVGNVAVFGLTVLTYKAGMASVDAGNVGTVTVRP